jgi:hypothetical protein
MGPSVTTAPVPSPSAGAGLPAPVSTPGAPASAQDATTASPDPSAPASAPAGHTTRIRTHDLVDRFLGSDPGLNRLRTALMSTLTIGLILQAEWLLVHFTNALQIQTPKGAAPLPAAQAAQVAVANHDYLVIMMLLGAILGMISGFGVMDPDARGQLITVLFLPVPMFPALALGIAVGGHRVLSLVLLAVILAAGTYLRRFGPRGVASGMLLFMGFFFGFFLHGEISAGDLGWVAAALGVGDAVALLVRFGLFYPRQAKALQRTQRSYAARARKVAALALELFEDPAHGEREVRQLQRHLVRLNEAALMIDAQLADPAAVAEGSSGQLLHQGLFDIELALTNIARFAEAMARMDLPEDQCAEVRQALRDIAHSDLAGAGQHARSLRTLLPATGPSAWGDDPTKVVVPHRFAGSVIALSEVGTEWLALGRTDEGKGTFEPAVTLFGGWLPGSAQVSAVASAERGLRSGDRVTLAPYTRAAIQVGIAVGASIALGDLLSGRRFYWAVIAAFITFMGVNNSGEQARKGLFRIAGTVVGIGIGSLLVTAVGHHPYWSIAVILLSLFFGFYLMRINYAFMVVGITVTVSQLYVALGEFSNSLLGLRLAETAVGATVAIIVVTFVLPLRTRRVLRVALRDHLYAVAALVHHATCRLLGEECSESTLRADARAVDVSYQALEATAQPLRRNLFGSFDEDTGQVMRLASASRHYSRNLVNDVEGVGPFDAEMRLDITRAGATLQSSLDILADSLTTPTPTPTPRAPDPDRTPEPTPTTTLDTGPEATAPTRPQYTRSSSLFDRTERRLEERAARIDEGELAIRDLKLIDGVMAKMAALAGLPVTDFDTVGTATP